MYKDLPFILGDYFQKTVREWCIKCFGPTIAKDPTERTWRFLEEAVELAQACGADQRDVEEMAKRVFSRKAGEPRQEVGGVMVTLGALCSAYHINMMEEAITELDRIQNPDTTQKIRKKHYYKSFRIALPEDFPYVEGLSPDELQTIHETYPIIDLDPGDENRPDFTCYIKINGLRYFFNGPADADDMRKKLLGLTPEQLNDHQVLQSIWMTI